MIPGANVVVTNVETGTEFTAQTGANGTYLIPNLPAATYDVAASADGFKKRTIRNLRLNANTQSQQNFALELGAVTETVEVTAAQLQVQTTSGSVGQAVQIEQIQELPQINRNVFSLVNLVPGAFFKNGRVSIGGGRTQSALAQVDGVNNSRGGLGVQNIEMAPPIDSMQEFKVEVNAMGAEYGRSSSGVINAVTRSGTNRWTGSLYEFLRNDKLDAAGWNNDTKPKLRRNNFGFTIGGPIKKNKTFIFYNADFFRQRNGVVRTRNVGLPEWHTGDFSTATQKKGNSAVVVPVYDPDSRTDGSFTDPRGTSPFPNNIIPSSRLDPVAVQAAAFYPGPNRPANNPFNQAGNWQENTNNERNRDYHTMRLDHTFTQKWRSYIRYIFTDPDDSITGYSQGFGVADMNGLEVFNQRKNAALNNTYTFSPTFFVSTIIGFNRVHLRRKSGGCCDTNFADQFGIPELRDVAGETFPRFNVQGGRVPVSQIGAAGNANRVAAFTNFDFEANFTKIMGSHTLKFGGKYTAYQGNEVSRPQPSGVYRFTGNMTRSRTPGGKRDANTGINYADFMLGRVWNIDARVAPGIGKRIKYYSGYFQDDWKVTSRLTLNLGLRYEIESPITEVADRHNGFCQFCPNPAAGTNGIPENAIGRVLFPNRDGTGKYLWKWDKNNFAPRFGFAYRLKEDNSLVIRGGAGIFYGNPYDRNSIQPGRAGFDNIFRRRGGYNMLLSEGVPAGSLDNIPESELHGAFGVRGSRFETSTIQFFDQDREVPYTMNFNLTLQQSWKGINWEYGILGNLGRQTPFPNINLNHIDPKNLPLTAGLSEREKALRFRRWNAWSGNQNQIQIFAPNWGISNYWGLTFKSERRYQNGLGWTVAYTHVQWIDNLIFTGGGNSTFGDNDFPQNIYDIANERSGSTNRVPHRVVVAPIWDLPFGRNRALGSNWHPVLDAIAGGWQVSTIGTMQTGAPFGVLVQNGPADIRNDTAPGTVLRPHLTGAPIELSNRGDPAPNGIIGKVFLNEAAFENPAQFTLGNASRTLPGVYGAPIVSFDFMLAKNFRWGERYRAQFRWEMLNFMNTPQFNLPNQAFGDSNFGIVGGASGRRIMQLGMKVYF